MTIRPQVNLRLDPRSAALLGALEERLNLNAAGVVRVALARLAQLEGITIKKEDEHAPD